MKSIVNEKKYVCSTSSMSWRDCMIINVIWFVDFDALRKCWLFANFCLHANIMIVQSRHVTTIVDSSKLLLFFNYCEIDRELQIKNIFWFCRHVENLCQQTCVDNIQRRYSFKIEYQIDNYDVVDINHEKNFNQFVIVFAIEKHNVVFICVENIKKHVVMRKIDKHIIKNFRYRSKILYCHKWLSTKYRK